MRFKQGHYPLRHPTGSPVPQPHLRPLPNPHHIPTQTIARESSANNAERNQRSPTRSPSPSSFGNGSRKRGVVGQKERHEREISSQSYKGHAVREVRKLATAKEHGEDCGRAKVRLFLILNVLKNTKTSSSATFSDDEARQSTSSSEAFPAKALRGVWDPFVMDFE